MAKISFAKLGLAKNTAVTTVCYNEQMIEVKQYLSVNDKLELISNVINCASDGNFQNPVKVNVFTMLEILYFYTNINFTDKQKEDPCKLYDLVSGTGFLDKILEVIPDSELECLLSAINYCMESIYDYKNSVMGIFDAIANDYNNVNFDLDAIREKLSDPDALAVLREIAPVMGQNA